MPWIICRSGTPGRGTRVRKPNGHLTWDLWKAARFDTASQAFPHAQEGDTVTHVSAAALEAPE